MSTFPSRSCWQSCRANVFSVYHHIHHSLLIHSLDTSPSHSPPSPPNRIPAMSMRDRIPATSRRAPYPEGHGCAPYSHPLFPLRLPVANAWLLDWAAREMGAGAIAPPVADRPRRVRIDAGEGVRWMPGSSCTTSHKSALSGADRRGRWRDARRGRNGNRLLLTQSPGAPRRHLT